MALLWWEMGARGESLTRRTRTSGFQTERWRCCRRRGFLPWWSLWCPRTLDLGSGTDLWLRESTKTESEKGYERLWEHWSSREKKDKPKGRQKRWVSSTLGNLLKPSCIIKDPPANYSYSYCQADGGGVQRRWREERIKPGALRVPERSSSCVSRIAALVSEWSFLKTVWK